MYIQGKVIQLEKSIFEHNYLIFNTKYASNLDRLLDESFDSYRGRLSNVLNLRLS